MASFASGEKVRILDGVFAHFTGVVTSVNAERRTLELVLTLLSPELATELRFAQVQKAA